MLIRCSKRTQQIVAVLILFLFINSLLISTSYAIEAPQEQWIKIFSSSQDDKAYAVATDSNNNVIVTGFSKMLGDEKCYTIKYSQDGTVLFDIIEDIDYECKSYDVCVDSQDNIIISGYFFDNNYNYFIVKYNSEGIEQWNISYDGSTQDIAYGLAIDSFDNIIVTGGSSGNYHTIKYDKFGNEIWNKTYVNSYNSIATSVAIDYNNNIIITGYIEKETSKDWLTVKYDSFGNELWNKSFSNGNYNTAKGVSVDSFNNIIVFGTIFYGSNSNMDIMKYDPDGNLIWHESYDNSVVETGEDVIINDYDDIIFVGASYFTLEQQNYLLVKYDSNGNYIWSIDYDRNSDEDSCVAVTLDSTNKIIITGYTKNSQTNYDYMTIKYGEKPIANFTYSPLQPITSDNIQFIDNSIDPAGIITDWSWDFGDGYSSTLQNPTHQYADDGTYTVILTITDDDNNVDSFSDNIYVANTPPSANFTYTPLISTPLESFNFMDTSFDYDGNIVSWFWDFGDSNNSTAQNPNHFYTNPGMYCVTLIVSDNDGSNGNISKNVFVNQEPLSMFSYTPTTVYTNQVINFNDESIDNFAPIVSWHWNFGDGYTSILQNPTHSYGNNGVYTVTLTVTDEYGLTNESSQQINILNIAPTADFSFNPLNPTDLEIISFNDLSNDPDGVIVAWNWSFGDGSYSEIQNQSHQYTDDAQYIVTLTVQDNNGATDLFSKTVEVTNIAPVADFNLTLSNTTGNLVSLNDLSYDLDGYIVNWTYDFGDGNVSYEQNVTYQYNQSGSYNITLFIVDDDGATHSILKTVSTLLPPSKVTGLNITDAREGRLDLTWDIVNDSIAIDYYKIYRDGVFLINITTNTYQDTGLNNDQNYTYQISAVNILGFEGEKSDPANGTPTAINNNNDDNIIYHSSSSGPSYSNKYPVADASIGEPYIAFIGEEIAFNGSLSYDPDGEIISYVWDLGDGTSKTGKTVLHKYNTSGVYNISLTVTDNQNAKDKYDTQAIIKKPNIPPTKPIINGPKSGDINVEYTYTAVSTDEDNDSLQYYIDWDDGYATTTVFQPNGTQINQIHAWNAAGRYVISVNATDNQTFSETSEYIVFINAVEINYLGINIGYLIDENNDGSYDSFYNYKTSNQTDVEEISPGIYLIDIDGDGSNDIVYNAEKNETTQYSSAPKSSFGNDLTIFLFVLLLCLLLILLMLLPPIRNKKIIKKIKNIKIKEKILSKIPIGQKKQLKQFFKKSKRRLKPIPSSYQMSIKEIEKFVDSMPDLRGIQTNFSELDKQTSESIIDDNVKKQIDIS